ncbi:MAG: glycine zipper family protein [Rhizomicrobium sp.]
MAAGALSACATQPAGPTIPVMPGANKPFAAFQRDDEVCQQYAGSQVAGGAKAANNRAIAEGVLGTALGAGLGAAIGGGRGAGVGAAGGAAVGTAVGANSSTDAQVGLQRRYNIAYAQCMTSKGNKVVAGYPPPYDYGYGYGPPYPPPPPPPPPY